MKKIGFLLLSVCLLVLFTACNTAADNSSAALSQEEGRTSATSVGISVTTIGNTVAETTAGVTEQTTSTGGTSMSTTTATTVRKSVVTTVATVPTTEKVTATTTRPSYSSPLGGLYLSILGDSLSSYDGYSNVGDTNTTVLGKDKGEGMETILSSVRETYWMQVIARHEMKLLVNNSWPGSLMRGSSGSAGAGLRAESLHANIGPLDGTKPDVIAVFMGTNDLFWSQLGDFSEALPASLITDRGNGVYTYAEGTNFAESYVIAMHKMTTAYPDAEVFCFTLHPNKGCADKVIQQFNEIIRAVAGYYGASVVDLYASELTATDTYLADSLHFNANGMKVVADLFEEALLRAFPR